jgi:hypothetical protein
MCPQLFESASAYLSYRTQSKLLHRHYADSWNAADRQGGREVNDLARRYTGAGAVGDVISQQN